MAKTVLDTQGAAHVWVAFNRGTTEQDYARNARDSFRFRGASCYSYATEIARWIAPPSRPWLPFVLLSSRSYSMTTNGKHKPAVRHAIPDSIRVIEFDGPGTGREFPMDPQAWFADCIRAAEELQTKAKRARSNREWLLNQAHSKLADAQFLGASYGFPCGDLDEMTDGLRRAREGAEAIANIGRFFQSYFRAMDALWDNLGQAFKDIATGVGFLAKAPTLHGAWAHFGTSDMFPTLLRVEGDMVRTSRGAEFPLEHGLKALPFIKAAMRHGGADVSEQPAFVNRRLGHFRIDRVGPNGTVHAGCHMVPLFAIQWAARAAGACEVPEMDHVAAAVDFARAEIKADAIREERAREIAEMAHA